MQNKIQPIIDPINSLLQSRVLKVKEKITKGQIILDINPTEFESSFDTKLIDQAIYNSHERSHSNLNSNLPQIDDYMLIRKICLKSRQSKKILSPKEVLNPKEIIQRRRKQFQDKTQNDKMTSFKIFRTTKSTLRSISKEIDKRTKQQFGLVKKTFNFMQYDNFFHPCSKLKANDNNNRSIKCFNLPFLQQNSSFLSKNLLDMTVDNKINSIQMLPRKISTNQEYSINSNSNTNTNNNITIAIEDNLKKSIKRHNEKYSLSKMELKREISLKKLGRTSLKYF